MNNQDDLPDDLDPRLQRLYHQLPKEQPSAELDAKILAAANAVKTTSRRWQTSLALAASVVMVSSLVLYLRQEQPSVFEQVVSVKQPATQSAPEMSKNGSISAEIAQPVPVPQLADNKVSVHRQKDTVLAPKQSPMTSADTLSARSEKKIAIDNDIEQLSKVKAAASSEQESKFADAPTVAASAPALQSLQRADVSELDDLRGAGGQPAEAEADKLTKPSSAPLARAQMAAAPITSTASLAGLAMPAAKQRAKRDESSAKVKVENISAPVVAIEGVAMGMSREQLVLQGLTCYVDVCHMDVSQPQQLAYWGMPSANAHLTAFLSRNIVTKLVVQQKNVSPESVKASLLTIGRESQQSCIEEKGTILVARQLGANLFNLRSTGTGLSLAICQYIETDK